MKRAILIYLAIDLLASAIALAFTVPAFLPDRLSHHSARVWLVDASGNASLAMESSHD